MSDEAKKPNLLQTPISQDTSRTRDAFDDGNLNFIRKRNKFFDGLDQNIFECAVKPYLDNFPPNLSAIVYFDENISKSVEEALSAEARSKACGPFNSLRFKLCSFNNIDQLIMSLSKRCHVAKPIVQAQSTPSSFDLATKPISPNPTKEIETPILSFDEMLDRKAETCIRLGTGITGRKLHNIAFNQDVAPYLQSTELSNVFFVTAKGVYYRPFALDIL